MSYGEPWYLFETPEGSNAATIHDSSGDPILWGVKGNRIKRASPCVNALAGIEDVEEFMRLVRSLIRYTLGGIVFDLELKIGIAEQLAAMLEGSVPASCQVAKEEHGDKFLILLRLLLDTILHPSKNIKTIERRLITKYAEQLAEMLKEDEHE